MAAAVVSVEVVVLEVAPDFAVLPVLAAAVDSTVLPDIEAVPVIEVIRVIEAALVIMVVGVIAGVPDIEAVPGIMDIGATGDTIMAHPGFLAFRAIILITVITRIEDITADITATTVDFRMVRIE